MQWSSFQDQPKNEENKPAEVKEFQPRIFTLNKNEANATYLAGKKSGSDFVMSDVVKKISGISDIEKTNEDKKVQDQLDILKGKAYEEAFQAGLADGFKAGVEEHKAEINKTIDDFKALVHSIENLKTDLVHQNEAHIVTAIFRIAEKIAYGHIQENPDLVLPVLKQSIDLAQSEDEVTVLVSPAQVEFIEKLKLAAGRDFDFLKNVRLEASPSVVSGGCIIETNYGVIDARIEKRVQNIWAELNEALPKIKKIAG
jgi:flagellar assembly protein FliH